MARSNLMSSPKLLYIELKTGHGDSGPAWITRARLSASGRTVYFNGKALKRSRGQGIQGNHYDLETGDEYWISGVKKNGQDRHWAGAGKVRIDRAVVDEYLAFIGRTQLDPSCHEICDDIPATDIQRLNEIENRSLSGERE
jgi:hypothetical protein